MYSYVAYGLGIRSDFFLPELVASESREDVIILRGSGQELRPSGTSSEIDSWITNREIFRFFLDVGSFLVRDGREIIVDPAPGAEERVVRNFLLGFAMGAVLYQRGFLALHGSGVSIGGGVAVFLGSSGRGKSTIAAALGANGHPLVVDDVVAIKANSDDVPVVYPAFPQLKLWPDAAESLGYDINDLPIISPRETKRAARLTRGFSIEPLPLGRVYIIEEGDSIAIIPLSKQKAIMQLIRNTYTIRYLKAGVNVPGHFLHCANVARAVPVCRLIRPNDLKLLPEVVRVIEDDLSHEV